MGSFLDACKSFGADLCPNVGALDLATFTSGPTDELIMEIPHSTSFADVVYMWNLEIMVD